MNKKTHICIPRAGCQNPCISSRVIRVYCQKNVIFDMIGTDFTCSVAKYRFTWFGTLFFYKGAKDNSCLFVCIPCFGTLYHRKGTKATNIYKKHQKWFETLYFFWGQKIIHIQIAKNRNYIIIGRVAVLPLTGKYCMGKRGVAASELSTVRKKPGYHADFVIWGFGTLLFYKGAKAPD